MKKLNLTYNKIMRKMINYDKVTKENINKHSLIGREILIIHAEY